VAWKPVPKIRQSTSRRVPSRDAGGDDVDVLPRERRVVVVGDQHALAADGVVGRDLVAQDRISDAALDMTARHQLHRLHQLGVDHEAQHARFEHPVDAGAHQLLREGQVAEQPVLGARHFAVGLGQDPRRGALVQVEPARLGRDLRHELDGRGTGADHGHALAAQVVVVLPQLRVEGLALEGVDAGDVRPRRAAQAAHAGDQRTGPVAAAVGHVEIPHAGDIVEGRACQRMVEADMPAHAKLVGAALQVGADFRLRREHARPVRIGRERERIQMRLHIARAARVVVVAPGAAHRVGLLEDHEIVDAVLLELDRHA
jgi:hypothetical protein